MENMTADYARGYTDALSHVRLSLQDLDGQIEAVIEDVLKRVAPKEETPEVQ